MDTNSNMRKLAILVQSSTNADNSGNVQHLENVLQQSLEIQKAQHSEIEHLSKVYMQKQMELSWLELESKRLSEMCDNNEAVEIELDTAMQEIRGLNERLEPDIKVQQTHVSQVMHDFNVEIQELQHTLCKLNANIEGLTKELEVETNTQKEHSEIHDVTVQNLNELIIESQKNIEVQKESLQQQQNEVQILELVLKDKETLMKALTEENEELKDVLKKEECCFVKEHQNCYEKKLLIDKQLIEMDYRLTVIGKSVDEVKVSNYKLTTDIEMICTKLQELDENSTNPQEKLSTLLVSQATDSEPYQLANSRNKDAILQLEAEAEVLLKSLSDAEERLQTFQQDADALGNPNQELSGIDGHFIRIQETFNAEHNKLLAVERKIADSTKLLHAYEAHSNLEKERASHSLTIGELKNQLETLKMEYQANKELCKLLHSECTILKKRIQELEASKKSQGIAGEKRAAVNELQISKQMKCVETADSESSMSSQATFDGVPVQRFNKATFEAALQRK